MKSKILKSKNPEFILRHITMNDAQGYFECQSDDYAARMFMCAPKNLKQAKKELREDLKRMSGRKPTEEMFIIDVNGKCAGIIWLNDISYGFLKHKAGIGYAVHKDFRGKGYGGKAIKMITDYAFKKYKLVRMATHTRDFNIPSRKCLEKAGYQLEGILRKNKIKDGKYVNDCIYAKVR
jgi:ribosomal-protein-alanine N-acetyltransferase